MWLNLQAAYLSESVAPIAVGMEDILQQGVDQRELLCRLLLGLESVYDEFFHNGFGLLRQEWEERSPMLGREVHVSTVNGDLDGAVLGLSEEGFCGFNWKTAKSPM